MSDYGRGPRGSPGGFSNGYLGYAGLADRSDVDGKHIGLDGS